METINFQEKVKELREKHSAKDSTGKHSEKISICPVDKCDGTGFIVEDGKATPCECREKKIMDNKLQFAEIKNEFEDVNIADFGVDQDYYQEKLSIKRAKRAKKSAWSFVHNKFEEMKQKGKGLYFWSNEAGSGKTMLISSMGNELIEEHKAQVKFATAGDLLDAIRKTYGSDSEFETHELIQTAQDIEVLILDDMGQQSVKSDTNDHLFKILNNRMDKEVVTIFSSNCKPENLPYDYRINSRIKDMAIPIRFPEESARDNLAEQENNEILNELMEG